ncbi:MAG: translation factor Sua5 [Bacteroidetes bacterium]|nr:MAG: translation factor Sua5 [Bacteroidota bacterium]
MRGRVARKKVNRNSEVWREDALEAVRTLRSGGVIVHATDTVWGIACDATNEDAVMKLRTIKGKKSDSPILVLVADEGLIEKHISDVPDAAWDLFEHNDRPTTVIMPGGKNVTPSILGEGNSLGMRLVKDVWTTFVSRGLGRPLASSSANLSGSPTPIDFNSIDNSIIKGADFVSSHRRSDNSHSKPSFIASFDSAGRFKILRS